MIERTDMKHLLRFASITFAGLLAVVVAAPVFAQSPARQPNVLYIMTDQQRFDGLGSVSPGLQTPALDRLCREGVRFDRAYVAQAVCTPSRASIFSGLYPHSHRLQTNQPMPPDALASPQFNLSLTWPLVLQKAGYHTAYIGKWHLGEKGPPCFDEWFGFNSLLPHWIGSRYRPDVETETGTAFLERNKDRPFVLCQSYYPPHTPFNPPKQFSELYKDTRFQPAEYWGAITAVDACVGRLLKKLDEIGQMDNTVIVFTSDHGEHFGKRPGGKHKEGAYDDAARVPLIIRYPKLFKGGTVRKELVSSVDIMPTILELTGRPVPDSLQGRSLAGLASGASADWRQLVVIENEEEPPKGDKGHATSRGIRTEQYKLILRAKLSLGAKTLYEFYDLTADPAEKRSIYGKAQAEAIRKILDGFDEWAAKTGDEKGRQLAAACRANLGTTGRD